MKLPFKITPLIAIVAAVVVILLVAVGYYNSFVTKTNAIEGQWQQVEVQYQRRVDLIPNLVASVKGLQQQEQRIVEQVTEARKSYVSAQTPEDKVKAANQLEGSLGRLIAIFENYPQVKSDAAVVRLMDELAGTENRVSVERRRYNEQVRDYNTTVARLPGKLFASLMGFGPKTYFESTPGSENVPKVEF